MTLRIAISFVFLIVPLFSQIGSKAPVWSLRDGNDKTYDSAGFVGKTVVLIGGDKKSQETNGAWITGVKNSCGRQLTGLGLAEASAVPRLLRGMYQKRFREDSTRMGVPLLIDWDGSVARSFHFKPDVSNVVLIGPDSSIVFAASGAVTDDGIKKLCTAAGKQPSAN
jgi:predicted transcriptional regulator